MGQSFFRIFFTRRIIVIFFLGISSGLPLLAIGSTLQAWMTEEGINLGTIGLFSLVGLPYTIKFIWAPLFDRFSIPVLGRRRGWIIISQVFLVFSLILLGLSTPGSSLGMTILSAFFVAFFSATQDIVVDAHRRDILNDNELGLGLSVYVTGYRIGMLVSGSLALIFAEYIPWPQVYLILGALIGIGIIAALFAPEPENVKPPTRIREAVILPLKDFFSRENAFLILSFALLYKLGESMASSMTTPLYLSVGFSKVDIGLIAKTIGMGATISGGLIGGYLLLRMPIKKALYLFGILQAVFLLSFSVLSFTGPVKEILALAIGAEAFTSAMATSAYGAFLASVCNRKFSATQYALFSSLMGVPRVLFSTPTGYIVNSVGFGVFFVLCAIITIPGIVLIKPMLRFSRDS